jgi:hypothetical protein
MVTWMSNFTMKVLQLYTCFLYVVQRGCYKNPHLRTVHLEAIPEPLLAAITKRSSKYSAMSRWIPGHDAAVNSVSPSSHVSHFLGRARSGIVFAVGKTQVYWTHTHLSPSSLRWRTFTWSPQILPAPSLWMSELKLMRIPAHMWMSVVRWRASPQRARPRKW